jgi:hypothetical protein
MISPAPRPPSARSTLSSRSPPSEPRLIPCASYIHVHTLPIRQQGLPRQLNPVLLIRTGIARRHAGLPCGIPPRH